MSGLGDETLTTALGAGQKEVELLEKLLKALFELLKFVSEAREREVNIKLKKAELKKVKQTQNVEEARIYLNKSRGCVKARYMQNAQKELSPLFQPMSPAELKRFDSLAKTYGLNYYTMRNKAAVEKYTEVKKELAGLKKEQQRGRDKLVEQYGEKLSSLKDQYADLQADLEGRAVTPADRKRLSDLDKEINELEDTMNRETLSQEQLARKEQLEKQLEVLEKERDDVIIVVFKEDMPIVENITERMNEEIDLENNSRQADSNEKQATESRDQEQNESVSHEENTQSSAQWKEQMNSQGNVNRTEVPAQDTHERV